MIDDPRIEAEDMKQARGEYDEIFEDEVVNMDTLQLALALWYAKDQELKREARKVQP